MTRPPRIHRRAFTLFEVILALAILVLLSGAIFFLTTSVLEATKSTRDEQIASRRLEGFLRVTRDTFLGLDVKGDIFLRMESNSGTVPVPELVIQETSGAFGVPTLAGGSLVLAARPLADGSRVFSLQRVPEETTAEADRSQPWIPLLPHVERVKWTFYSQNEWTEEWAEGQGRPKLVRLNFESRDLPGPPVDAIFWIPPLQDAPAARSEPPEGAAPPPEANPPEIAP